MSNLHRNNAKSSLKATICYLSYELVGKFRVSWFLANKQHKSAYYQTLIQTARTEVVAQIRRVNNKEGDRKVANVSKI